MTERIGNLSGQMLYQQTEEIELLNSIKRLAGNEVAERAVNKYSDIKHVAINIYKLSKLNEFLYAGMSIDMAFEAVDIDLPAEKIIDMYRSLSSNY